MVAYRRNRLPGGTYFFTVTLHNRASSLLITHAAVLGEAMREVRARHPFETLAIVVLPDHLHAIWRLPDGDTDYSTRWRLIKSGFTRRIIDKGIPLSMRSKWRTKTLGATILETYDPGRERLTTACRLHTRQSGETRLGRTHRRLAVVQLPSTPHHPSNAQSVARVEAEGAKPGALRAASTYKTRSP